MIEAEPAAREGSSPRPVEATHRGVTLPRVVALAVIAVLVFGLAYVRFAPGPTPVSVPPGAKAGDLTLKPCTYTTESGDRAAECGTLIVNENRANPASRLIALPITRIKATSAARTEPMFYFEGGPGLSNAAFKQASRFAA